MKQLLLLLILFTGHNFQQDKKSHYSFACSYYGEVLTPVVTTYSPATEAESIIKQIVGIIGLKPNFEIRSADVPNAAAVVYNGKRYILYNNKFINNLNRQVGNTWASVSIIAHEIGHHLNGHTITENGSRPDIELEADEFSGFVLRKMGATLKDAQAAMKLAADIKASHSHPARAERLVAIANGWTNANNQIVAGSAPPKTNKTIQAPVIAQKTEKPKYDVLAEKYIAYDVNFFADANGSYFVTIKNHLVKVTDNDLIIAGVLAQSNKKGYQAMLYDKEYNYLYITNNLQIVNGQNKKVGTISPHKKYGVSLLTK